MTGVQTCALPISCPTWYPDVSPDGRYLAYAFEGNLTVVEIATGDTVATWTIPFSLGPCLVRWSPDGKEISIGTLELLWWRSGLWIYNFERKEGRHLLGWGALCCNWSPNRSQVALDIMWPVSQVWLAPMQPTMTTVESLGPVQTRGEYLRSCWQHYVNMSRAEGFYHAKQMHRNLIAVAADQYECRRYKDALWTLEHNAQAHQWHGYAPEVANTAYTVMTLDRLGRYEESRKLLQDLCETCAHGAGEDEIYLCMAEKVLLAADDKLVEIWDCIQRSELDEALSLVEALQSNDITDRESLNRARATLARLFWRRGRQAGHTDNGMLTQSAHYRTALRTDPHCLRALRDLAWLLAAAGDNDLRDGTTALEYARQACELTEYQDCDCLAAMAAAYAECGDFAAAEEWQREAIKHVPDKMPADEFEARLQLYQASEHIHAVQLRPLVGWWKCESDDVMEVRDASGNGLNGVLVGNARIVRDPKRGHVLQLDGKGSSVNCGADIRLNITDTITVSVWVKWSGPAEALSTILAKDWGGYKLDNTDWHDRDTVKFACPGLSVPGRLSCETNSKTNMRDGKWHHIVGVYDGAGSYLYVDGRLEDSNSAGGQLRIVDAPLCIGALREKSDRVWQGLIDDVRIYRCALNRWQIEALHEENNRPLPRNVHR